MNEQIQTIAVYALPILFAITLHEAARGFAAKYFGDLTAYQQGRLSWDPLHYVDPLGTIVIPIVLYLATDGQFLFGYPKAVPVNYGNLRHPKRDMAWVSLAGPVANLVMGLLWLLMALVLQAADVQKVFFIRMTEAGLLTNLIMFAFTMFPLPPMAGGRVLISLLPAKYAYKLAQMEPYGFFVVMILAMLHVLQYWMLPIMTLADLLLHLLVYPFTFLLS